MIIKLRHFGGGGGKSKHHQFIQLGQVLYA